MIIVHFFLLTNSGDPDGIWNDLRPFRLNLSTGNIILGSDILTVINGGNIGIGTLTPGAKLTVGENLGGTAASTTFKTNAGSLGSISGSTIKLASIGFQSSNSSSLGIEARRTSDGEDWQTTAIGLKHDVDNNSPVRNSEIWLTASGKIGVGTVNLYGRFSIQPLGTLDDNTPLFEVKNKLGVPVLAVYNNGVRILVEDTDGKGVKGGFAIGGFDPTKAGEETVNLMMVSADSIRFNIDNNLAKSQSNQGNLCKLRLNRLLQDNIMHLLDIVPEQITKQECLMYLSVTNLGKAVRMSLTGPSWVLLQDVALQVITIHFSEAGVVYRT